MTMTSAPSTRWKRPSTEENPKTLWPCQAVNWTQTWWTRLLRCRTARLATDLK